MIPDPVAVPRGLVSASNCALRFAALALSRCIGQEPLRATEQPVRGEVEEGISSSSALKTVRD
jgi:hypothetical protein